MIIINLLKEALGEKKILTGQQLEGKYHHIWKMEEPLKGRAFCLPTTTEEVSTICKLCYEHNQKMLVFGGLSNLVGATETSGDEIIISLEKLNQIEKINIQNKTMTVQSGAILETIQQEAKQNDLFFPLSFGAKGTAQIGGCISTNAGGVRVLKYGMTRKQLLGIEVVLPDGTIISSLKEMIKNNSGYDLKQLFVGAEGTLGIVTKAVLKLEEAPLSRNSAFLAVNSFDKVISLLKLMSKYLGSQLSAFELMSQSTYNAITAAHTHWRKPLTESASYYVLLETLGSAPSADKALLENALEKAMSQSLFEDGVMAHSEADLNWFWGIREDVSILNQVCPFDQHFDISLPISKMENYIKNVENKIVQIKGVTHCFTFGHVADGNMHFIIGKISSDDNLRLSINNVVYNEIPSVNGSVSAEHGIGLHKKAYLSLCREENEINLMRSIKRSLDPKNLLNSNRIFDF